MPTLLDDDDDPPLPGRLTPQQLNTLESLENPYHLRDLDARFKAQPVSRRPSGKWVTICGLKVGFLDTMAD